MSKFACVFFLLGFFALPGCNDQGEPEPEAESFLTVTLGAGYSASGDMWAFATDDTGKLLDAGPLQTGSSLTLKAVSPPETFNLTTHSSGGGPKPSHLFYTYTGITKGREITFERTGGSPMIPSVTGKATINIQNCSPYSYFVFSDVHAYSQFASQGNTSVNVLFDLRQNSSNILISSHLAMDQPVYGWVDDATDGGTYTLDFNSLTPFPKNIVIPFSESMSGLIIGRNSDMNSNGYMMTNTGFSTVSATPVVAKFGYLDGFDEYQLFVTSSNTMDSYYRSMLYIKKGATLPEEITFPDNTLTIESESIGNFSFNYSSAFTYSNHYWRQDDTDQTVHWRIFTDKSTVPAITQLPQAFSAKYPSVSLSNLPYVESDFFRHQDGYTYLQWLDDSFAGILDRRPEYFADYFQKR